MILDREMSRLHAFDSRSTFFEIMHHFEQVIDWALLGSKEVNKDGIGNSRVHEKGNQDNKNFWSHKRGYSRKLSVPYLYKMPLE